MIKEAEDQKKKAGESTSSLDEEEDAVTTSTLLNGSGNEADKPREEVIIVNNAEEETDTGDLEATTRWKLASPKERIIIKVLFAAIFLTNIMLNFDGGAVPAVNAYEGQISNWFNLTPSQFGMLGALVYVGLSVACLGTGVVLTSYSPHKVVVLSLWVNTLSCLLFAVAPNAICLYASRFFIGFSQAIPITYYPVWVDEFAPMSSKAAWMGTLQAGASLGVVFGYVISGSIVNMDCEVCNDQSLGYDPTKSPALWRVPFLIQAGVLTLLSALASLAPKNLFDTKVERRTQSFAKPKLTMRDYGSSILLLLGTNRVFLYCMLGLSTLYFVVTGLQYYTTDYLVQYTGGTYMTAVGAFSVTAITAPVAGVIVGGILVDRAGGYEGPIQLEVATRIMAAESIVAGGFAILACISADMWVVVGMIWMTLFAGGALVPAGTGILIAIVPADLRSFASGLSQFVFNIMGYAMAPALGGVVTELTGELKWGFYTVMNWAWLGMLCMVLAWIHARAAKQKLEDTTVSTTRAETEAPDAKPPNYETNYDGKTDVVATS